MNTLNRTLVCAAFLTVTASCSGANETGSKTEAKTEVATMNKKNTKTAAAPATPAKANKGGQFLPNAPVKWNDLLRASPEDVAASLGAHTREGGGRISCVRFLPKRVHFACTHIARDYAHPAFEKVTVDFEDGRAAAVSLVGFKGAKGEFSVDGTLEAAGIKAARAPRPQSADGAEVFVWFNHEAQLLVGKDQFLMRLSTVDQDWAKTKLEVIFNGPLSEDEKSRTKAHKSGAGSAPAAEDNRPPQMKLK
jgi:hypothetical protein